MEKHLTEWFFENDRRFHVAAAEIINKFTTKERSTFILDKITLDRYSNEDVDFILSKVLGYVHGNTTLCGLIFSVLHREPENEQINQNVVWAFTNYISYNYPGASKVFLIEKLQNGLDVEKKIADSILKSMEIYYKPLREIPRLKEFEPPEKRVRTYLNMKARKQSEMIRSTAHESSVLMKLITKVTLKGGKTWLSKYGGVFSERSTLSEFSFSYEVPRGELLDPIGQQFRRIQWCSINRNEADHEIDYT